jgi:hypothetical protein
VDGAINQIVDEKNCLSARDRHTNFTQSDDDINNIIFAVP